MKDDSGFDVGWFVIKVLFFIGVIIMICGITTTLDCDTYLSEHKIVKCYDNSNNEIIGAECIDKTNDCTKGIIIFVLGLTMSIMFGLVLLSEDNDEK